MDEMKLTINASIGFHKEEFILSKVEGVEKIPTIVIQRNWHSMVSFSAPFVGIHHPSAKVLLLSLSDV